jgi:hypothetical protein
MPYSVEKLVHFNCDSCKKWWTVADAPIEVKKVWTCPWCGRVNYFDEELKNDLTKE